MGAGHLMRLRHLTSCCATSVARGKHRRSVEGCLLWAAEEFSLILNLATPAMVRSRRFPWIWMHSVRHIYTYVCSYLTSLGLTKQSRKWNYWIRAVAFNQHQRRSDVCCFCLSKTGLWVKNKTQTQSSGPLNSQ